MKAGAIFAITLASMGLSSSASAATVLYTLTCTSSAELCENFYGNGVLSFSLPQFPSPDKFVFNSFQFTSVSGTINDEPATFAPVEIYDLPDPGLTFYVSGTPRVYFSLVGTKFFQGSRNAPEMVAGDFSLYTFFIAGNGGMRTNFQLNAILEPGPIEEPSPVPVPFSWAMMLSGLAMLGAVRQITRSRSLPGRKAA